MSLSRRLSYLCLIVSVRNIASVSASAMGFTNETPFDSTDLVIKHLDKINRLAVLPLDFRLDKLLYVFDVTIPKPLMAFALQRVSIDVMPLFWTLPVSPAETLLVESELVFSAASIFHNGTTVPKFLICASEFLRVFFYGWQIDQYLKGFFVFVDRRIELEVREEGLLRPAGGAFALTTSATIFIVCR